MQQSKSAKLLSWWCTIQNCGGMTAADRRNHRRFYYWVLVWGVGSIAAGNVLQSDFAANKAISVAVIAVPIVLAIFTLRAYAYFFRSLDELTQKIQLEGLKLGFALGIFVMPTLELFDLADIRQFKSMTPWGVMIIGYWLGQILAVRRYR